MQIFENNELISPIYHRSLALTISKEFAHAQRGEIFVAKYQDSEQANRRRELLDVEQRANQEKVIREHGESQFQTQITNQLFDQVHAKITAEFDNKERLFNQILHIEPAASDILELMSLRATSIKRITPLVSSLPWLSNDLVNLVNKPQYRRNADVKVSDGGLAVSYIGIENLQMVMPVFILKHWLPTSTAPFGTMKRKIWQNSLSTANAARVLAQLHGFNEYTAFCGGMLSNIGTIAVSRCFNQIYNETHQAAVREAYDAKDKRLHTALLKIDTVPELLLELFSTHASVLSAEVVELMRFDRLRITEGIFDLAYAEDRKNMCDLAQIILKAKAYVYFRMLAKDELIDGDESKSWLSPSGLTNKEIALLNRSDIDHIKLNFN